MSTIRHDGYAIRDLSFQLSLIVLGMKQYVETKSIWSKKRTLYKEFFGEFERALRPALLNLAVNFRSMDDEIKRNKEDLKILNEYYKHRTVAYSLLDETELNLRHAASKIIHTENSYWYDKKAPHTEVATRLLKNENEHDLIIIDGKINGSPWTVGIDLLALSEQFYEYAEVACEHCGA